MNRYARPWTIRLLALALVCILPLATTPAAAVASAQASPQSNDLYVRYGADLYRIDFVTFQDDYNAAAAGNAGTATLSVKKAVFSGDASGAPFFGIGENTTSSDFVVTDGDSIPPVEGRNLADVVRWRGGVAWTIEVSADTFGTTYSIGGDVLTTEFSRAALGETDPGSPAEPVYVSLNGATAWIDSGEILAAAESMTRDGVVPSPQSQDLDDLAASFVDGERFLDGFLGLSMIGDSAQSSTAAATAAIGCFWDCLGCAGAVLAYGVSIGALVAACGVVPSPACLLGILGHEAAVIAVVAACGKCFECLGGGPSATPVP